MAEMLDELGDAHEIVGDEIEHEVGSDGCRASMFRTYLKIV